MADGCMLECDVYFLWSLLGCWLVLLWHFLLRIFLCFLVSWLLLHEGHHEVSGSDDVEVAFDDEVLVSDDSVAEVLVEGDHLEVDKMINASR